MSGIIICLILESTKPEPVLTIDDYYRASNAETYTGRTWECLLKLINDGNDVRVSPAEAFYIYHKKGCSIDTVKCYILSMNKAIRKTSSNTSMVSQKPFDKVHRCGVCHDPSSLRCGRCRKEYYCTKQHQEMHWIRHKKECDLKKGGVV
jgi:MYND finger